MSSALIDVIDLVPRQDDPEGQQDKHPGNGPPGVPPLRADRRTSESRLGRRVHFLLGSYIFVGVQISILAEFTRVKSATEFSSDESPDVKGLSLIEGKNIKIDINDDYNNPLLGWYNVKFIDTKKYENLNGCYFFNNNFVIDPVKRSIISGYLDNLPVFINEKNIYGIQFHPELSRNIGNYFFKKILEN